MTAVQGSCILCDGLNGGLTLWKTQYLKVDPDKYQAFLLSQAGIVHNAFNQPTLKLQDS